nr:MAG TPA: hypothetical protein [Caudoviricetes sp.]
MSHYEKCAIYAFILKYAEDNKKQSKGIKK